MTAPAPAKVAKAPQDMSPALGSSRRLRALTRCGWALPDLCNETGLTPAIALSLLWSPPDQVPTRLHAAIATQYRRLVTERAPETAEGQQAAATARINGWATSGDWDDVDHDPEPDRIEAPSDLDSSAITTEANRTQIAELQRALAKAEQDRDRVTAAQAAGDKALLQVTKQLDEERKARNTQLLQNEILAEEKEQLRILNLQQADDIATHRHEIDYLRAQAKARKPAPAPRVAEMVIERDAAGSRITITSRMAAQVRFGNAEVQLPPTAGQVA